MLARRLLQLGLVLGGLVSTSAAVFVTRCPGLFTADPAVVTEMAKVAPLLALGLVAHPTTMSTEVRARARVRVRVSESHSGVGVGLGLAVPLALPLLPWTWSRTPPP